MYKLNRAAPAYAGTPPRDRRPLHLRISDELRRQINLGELHPGDLLPSEHALMSRFGVSRGTVRHALAALRADGTITGSRGRPPEVRRSHLIQPLSELIGFSAWARALGMRPSGTVVEFGARPADEEQAEALRLRRGDPVYHLVRVRLADDEPLMIERTTFPPAVGQMLAGVDLDRQSVYAELARRGIVFASARHLVSAVAAARIDSRLLRIAPRAPLLRICRHSFSLSGELLEWSDDRYRADRVDFAVENAALASGNARRFEQAGER